MMRWFKLLLVMLMIGVSAFGVVGCDSNDGPAEEAGETVDEAAEEAQEGAEGALNDLKDRTEDLGGN